MASVIIVNMRQGFDINLNHLYTFALYNTIITKLKLDAYGKVRFVI